jgi:hypothetical protein
MAASESTKLQVNFKLADGTLINVYAVTQAELEAQLTSLQDTASLITATASSLGSSSAVSYATQSLGATPVAPQFTAPAPVADGSCKHGALVWRESKPGAPKAWKGWFCPSPKGTPDQCEPKFVR